MKIDRKFKKCQNCGYSLSDVYNYCPNCGQENRDDNVSFNTLIGDIFSTYLAVDSKVGRTVKPLFIRPGFLTNQYVEGKRVSYTHPIRIYLIVSLFYFFTLTLFVQSNDEEQEDVVRTSSVFNALDDVEGIDKESKIELIRILSSDEREALTDSLKSNDLEELKTYLTARDSLFQQQLRMAIGDSVANSLGLVSGTELAEKSPAPRFGQNTDDFILERIDFELIDKLEEEGLSNDAIYDSLSLQEINALEELVVRQSIRVNSSSNNEVMGYVVKNFPIMMLVLITIFALILKLLYVRRNELYIKHLIHALHLHSFAYLIYGIFILLSLYVLSENVSIVSNILAFLVVSVYAFISFLKVYHQHWFKTFIKFNLVGGIYVISIIVFFLVEMVISLLLF